MKNYKTAFFFISIFLISCASKKTEIKSNGYVQTGKISKNYRVGTWKYFYDSGELFQKGNFKKSKESGLWKIYHPNGALKQIGKFKNGNINGHWKFYHDNGMLYGTGNAVMGKFDGEWKWFFRNGQIHTVRNYENGRLRNVKFAKNYNGKSIDKGTIHNGTGSLIIYETEKLKDSIIEKLQYIEGILVDD